MSGRPDKLREVVPSLWQVFHYFWPYTRKHRWTVTRSVLMLFGSVVFSLLEPWPLAFVLDFVIPAKKLAVPFVGDLSPVALLMAAALGVVILAALRAITDYQCKVGFFLIGNRVVIEVRDKLYRHIQALSLSFHTKARSGDLIVRVTRDVSLLRDVTSTAVIPMAASMLLLVGMLTVMFLSQWRLALLALTTVPLFLFTTLRLTRRIRETARKQRRREGTMAAIASESISAIEVVQSLSLEDSFSENFSGRNKKSQKDDLKANRLSARLGRTVAVLLAVSTALVLGYGGFLAMNGEMRPGALVVFLVYVKRAFRPAQDFAKYTARLAKAAAAGERVISVLELTPDVQDLPDAEPIGVPKGHIRFDHVTFGYESGDLVLNDIDLDIAAGANVAIVGPSGTGKSTLAALILRLYDPLEGRVLIDGKDIRHHTLASLRSQISVVLQDNTLFALTVWENIGLGAQDASQEQIIAAARSANALEFIEDLPDGFDTVLGERGVTLSHGQRQRIAIARAIVRQTPILIIDEPTTGLDKENEQAVVDALERVAPGKTSITITHDLRLSAHADRIYRVENGQIVECGTHAELLEANGRYASLYRMQGAAVDAPS